MSSDVLRDAIRRLAQGGSLSQEQTASAFSAVMGGEGSPAQIAALLIGLRVKGETPEEVAGAALALRQAMVPLPALDPEGLVDTCGTGGGALSTFNISTAAALVAAGAGARVAKHGNRSFTSKCGSADVLEALGVDIEAPVAVAADVLQEAGIVFMYAPLMHPAMRHVGPVRRELAIPTVMNIVGPLANPASAGRQVIGVADEDRVELLAGALANLRSVHSLVVHGAPGLDEISPLGPTQVLEVREGQVTRWAVDPTSLGLALASPAELAGGTPAENAELIGEILAGRGPAGARVAVALNAAAALYAAGLAHDFPAGLDLATQALNDGAGAQALDRMRSAYTAAAARHAQG